MGSSFRIAFIFLLFNVALADYQLTILLENLKLTGFLPNGASCSPFSGLGVQCFPRPKICIEPSQYATNDFSQCSIGSFIDLGVWNNTNNLDFQPLGFYGGWYNPATFNFFNDYNGFSIKLIVWNAEGTAYQNITEFQWNIAKGDTSPTVKSGPQISSFKLSWQLGTQTAPTAAPASTTPGGSGNPSDCNDVHVAGKKTLTINGNNVDAYCDGQGGTAIQRRTDGSGAFDSTNLVDYQSTFGNPDTSYWLGLDNIWPLTKAKNYSAIIIACCGVNASRETYDTFSVGDANDGYKLTVTSSEATNRLLLKGGNTNLTDNGRKFSTFDNFEAGLDPSICAAALKAGGWWFGSCDNNLNGHYYTSSDSDPTTCVIENPLQKTYGAGISYPVSISYQKTQIMLYRKATLRNLDINAAAEDFCS